MKRHGGNEAQAKVIWDSYSREIQPQQLDGRFLFALEILDLQNAGYPAENLARILTHENWKWVSELKAAINEYTMKQSRKD